MKRIEKKKRENKAFTLIELLAVIIILSIISLIVGVVIGNVINNAKKEAYKESVRGMIRAAENYIGEYPLKHGKPLRYPTEFTCDGNTCSNEEDVLTFTNEVPKSGKIVILSASLVKASYISNDKFCVTGPKENLQIAKSCTDIDDTIPRIAGVQEGNILHLTLIDNESGIDAYCVNTVNDSTNCNWVSTTNSSVDHELNLSGTYYAFARDKKNNISESIEFVTGDIEKPIVTAELDGKIINIEVSDNASVVGYCVVNTNDSTGCTWNTISENSFGHTLSEAGTYYVFAKDSSGNISDGVEIEAPATAFCAYEIGHEFNFSYLTTYNGVSVAGASEEWSVPCNGLYKLEVWGATGGNSKGGYSVGYKPLSIGDTLYITCGGSGVGGKNAAGGYNGGGRSANQSSYNASGGGATHIAYVTGTLASIGYDSFVIQKNGLIVAGGAGGSCGTWASGGTTYVAGGNGGGASGNNGAYWQSQSASGHAGTGGTQSTGYAFGQGGNGSSDSGYGNGGGGGGGFYGGTGGAGSYPSTGTGGGGSGWIGGVPEIEYKGITHTPSMENGINSGAGYAKITLISY